MTISSESLKAAITDLAKINGILMNPSHLALDVLMLGNVFDEEAAFRNVVFSLVTNITNIVENGSIGEDLNRELKGYKSYHFSSPYPAYPGEEDMRIIYRNAEIIEILALGHRYTPKDIYERCSKRK